MKQSISRELYDYWALLKGARRAPEHNDVDLLAIRRLLANVFTLQIDGPRRFPLKMCGTRINAFWLAEQKGKSFLELWRADDRHKVALALSTVIDDAAPVVAGARSCSREATGLDVELLLLPLRHFGKTHSLMLGSLAPTELPAWLGRRAASPLSLSSLRVIHADERPTAPPRATRNEAPAFAGRPSLVLYEGGKFDDLRPS